MSPLARFRWSVRRELWENRYLLIVPPFIAGLILVGYAIHLPKVVDAISSLAAVAPAKQLKAAILPYGLSAAAILFISWIVGVYYCLEALNSERRDRSILFWKSMPVSDVTTVLSKASIPLAFLPIYACIVVLGTQLLMLALTTAVLSAKSIDPATLWSRLPFVQMPLGMFYGMAVHALWFAPTFGYLMMVSAWARRATFLWAFLPFFAAAALERMAFGSNHVWAFAKARLMGAMALAFKPDALNEPITQLSQLDPGRFLSSPALWIGLTLFAAFVVAAVRLRRFREPI